MSEDSRRHRDFMRAMLFRDAGARVKEPERCEAFYNEGFSCAEDFYKSKLDLAMRVLEIADKLIMNGYPDGGLQQAEWLKHRETLQKIRGEK